MPQFRVHVRVADLYVIEVDASSAEDAEDLALEIYRNEGTEQFEVSECGDPTVAWTPLETGDLP